MRSSWMNRAGKQLLFLDYSGLRDRASMRAEVAKADRVICSQELGSVLAIVDLRGAEGTRVFADLVKSASPFMDRLALVGLTGVRRAAAMIAARFSKSRVRLFDTRAEAIAWLLNGDVMSIGPRHPWEAVRAY